MHKNIFAAIALLVFSANAVRSEVKKTTAAPTVAPPAAASTAAATPAQRAARIALVNEFIREIGAFDHIQLIAQKELQDPATTTDKLMTGIRVSRRIDIEVQTSNAMLDDIRLDGRWGSFKESLQDINSQRQLRHRELTEMATELLSGPKPGVDYGKSVARMPQINAELESIDSLVFKIAPALFLCLVDDAAVDAAGILDRLIITNSQRKRMIDTITTTFGARLDQKDQNTFVSAGWLLKQGLAKDRYKSSDIK